MSKETNSERVGSMEPLDRCITHTRIGMLHDLHETKVLLVLLPGLRISQTKIVRNGFGGKSLCCSEQRKQGKGCPSFF